MYSKFVQLTIRAYNVVEFNCFRSISGRCREETVAGMLVRKAALNAEITLERVKTSTAYQSETAPQSERKAG